MFKQVLVSLIVLAAAFAGWVFYFPGATETLARYGITLPFAINAETPTEQQPGQRPGGNRATPTVVVAAATSAVINDNLSAIGEGSAVSSATVASASGGQLMELAVSPGEVIEAGALIARLDSDAEQIAFDQAQLAAADANATLARTTELASVNSATNVQIQTAQLAASTAELQLRNADLALQRRSIIAPISGTVGLLQVSLGNYVPAQTPVTTIDDTSEIVISFWVPERYASSIAIGTPVAASAVALPGRQFEGTVSAVDNRIDPASRTLEVEARLPNDDGDIRAGMSFSVVLSFPGESFVAVDPLSIQWSNDGAYVWKYADGKVAKGMIQIIQRNSDGVLVEGDVATGDQVVTQGVLQLSEGAEVKLLDEGDATPETVAEAIRGRS